jgi:hypothetical protein
MSGVEAVSAWAQTVSSQVPQLSTPQATVLALWSDGVVVAQRGGQTRVAAALAQLLGQREGTVRQRVRAGLDAAEDQRGRHRRARRGDLLGPAGGLEGGVVGASAAARAAASAGAGGDPTGQALCGGGAGGALPQLRGAGGRGSAWGVVPAGEPGAWRPHGERLLSRLPASVPAGWTGLVLAHRGR